MKAILFAMFCLTLTRAGLAAQESASVAAVSDWFRENARAGRYESIRGEVARIFASAEAAAVPADLLIDFLNEAAARNMPSAQVGPGLQRRLDELTALSVILAARRDCLSEPAAGAGEWPPPPLTDFFLMRRRGIPLAVIESVLETACVRGKKYGAALSALRTLANIPSLGELPEESMTALAQAILKSALSPTGYTALGSFYIKGKLKNIPAADITAIIISVLQEGKGLIRIEQELDRRRNP